MASEKSPLLHNGKHVESSYSRFTHDGLSDQSMRNSTEDSEKNGNDEHFGMGIERTLLSTPECGLSTVEASRRLKLFGPNEFTLPSRSPWRQLMIQLSEPQAIFLWIVMAFELARFEIISFLALLFLQLVYVIVDWLEQLKVMDAIPALKASLKPEALVIRDGVHQTINASLLVPGDRITLTPGAAIPADCELVHEGHIQVDQGVLTGESFPVTLREGDNVKRGSTVVRGEADAIVTATGHHTFYANTIQAMSSQRETSALHSTILHLNVLAVMVTCVLTLFCLGHLFYKGDSTFMALPFGIMILVVVVPMSMPNVCLAMLTLGSRKLADEKAIVTHLDSIQRLASMNVFCSNKTGTLTRNKMELQDDLPIFCPSASREDVLVTAALAAKWKEPPVDAVDTLVLNAIDLRPLDQYTMLEHHGYDAFAKRTESTIRGPTGITFKVTKGDPQTVLMIAHNVDSIRDAVEAKVLDLARRGIRSLAVARTDNSVDGQWIFLGIITFLDPPRHDTKRMVERAHALGVTVKLITGDQAAIAVETCRQLGMGSTILSVDALPSAGFPTLLSGNGIYQSVLGASESGAIIENADGFAQLLPGHKATIAGILRERGWLCGMTGAGIEDVGALKCAHVGFAVDGATDAARFAADVVLAKPGLAVIVNAVTITREVIQRIRSYVIHQLASTVHYLAFFSVSILFIQPDNCQFRGFGPLFGTCPGEEVNDTEAIPPYFRLPIIAIAIIALIRSVTTGTLVRDKFVPSEQPQTWCSTRIVCRSLVSGLVAALGSLLLLYWSLDSWSDNSVLGSYGAGQLSFHQVMTTVYLEISLSSALSIFSSNDGGWFFTHRPTTLSCIVVVLTATVTTLVGLFSPFTAMESLPLKTVLFVWMYSLVFFVMRDIVKVSTSKMFNSRLIRGVFLVDDMTEKYKLHETHRQNRIRLGNTYSSGESTIRDSFVTGRAVRPSVVTEPRALEQVLSRLSQLELELKRSKDVILSATHM